MHTNASYRFQNVFPMIVMSFLQPINFSLQLITNLIFLALDDSNYECIWNAVCVRKTVLTCFQYSQVLPSFQALPWQYVRGDGVASWKELAVWSQNLGMQFFHFLPLWP